MTINSVGYAGTVTDAEWARLVPFAGRAEYTIPDPDSFRASAASGDRNVDISPGTAAGQGILDESDATVTLNLPSVGSGSRWDMIGLERDWGTGASTLVRVAGSAAKALPSRTQNPGIADVQPLWLLRVAAGQTAIQEFVDLRVFVGEGGCYARDDLVRSYVTRVGTRISIGTDTWVRGLNATGTPVWTKDDTGHPATAITFAPSSTLTATDVQAAIEQAAFGGAWVPLTSLGPHWSATTGHPPRIRRVGKRVDIAGAVTRGTGGSTGNMLTLPVGYRPPINIFIGAVVSSQGRVAELFTSQTGILLNPPGYTTGSGTPGEVYPLTGSWYID